MVNLWTRGADKVAVARSVPPSEGLRRPLERAVASAESLADSMLGVDQLSTTAIGLLVVLIVAVVGVCGWLRWRAL